MLDVVINIVVAAFKLYFGIERSFFDKCSCKKRIQLHHILSENTNFYSYKNCFWMLKEKKVKAVQILLLKLRRLRINNTSLCMFFLDSSLLERMT